MVKIGRNDLCHCGSNKKYKKCCENNDMNNKKVEKNKYFTGQSVSSEIINDCKEIFKEDYETYNVIDITDDISLDTYRSYQVNNYNQNVIMLAERTEKNSYFFDAKCGSLDDNMIVMYKGSYRIFNQNNFLQVYESIQKMINTRDAGLEDR